MRILSIGLAFACVPVAALPATFTPLGGVVPGYAFSEAWAISADGTVVAGTSSNGQGGSEPFRWTLATGMTGLGTVPGGTPGGGASGMSGGADVIVGTGKLDQHGQAFQWRGSTGMTSLAPLSALPPTQNFAIAVSDDGTRIAGQSTSAGGPEATLWIDGAAVGLGDLPGGEFSSGVSDISADGQVVVGAGTPVFGQAEAFRWTVATGLEGLGFPTGASFSTATAISRDGAVIAGWGGTSLGSELAFLWTDANGFRSLGELPGGSAQSQANDLSEDGAVVVGNSIWSDGIVPARQEAFVWTEATGMQRLFDLLVAGGATGLDGWILSDATAISADGTVIAGWGRDPGRRAQAFVANLTTVPLPGSAGCLLTGLAAVLARVVGRTPGQRRRRSS